MPSSTLEVQAQAGERLQHLAQDNKTPEDAAYRQRQLCRSAANNEVPFRGLRTKAKDREDEGHVQMEGLL